MILYLFSTILKYNQIRPNITIEKYFNVFDQSDSKILNMSECNTNVKIQHNNYYEI